MVPPRDIDPADLKNPALYINRELSWLAFNERVLDQARDTAHPLLERVKFLGITGRNLDEFFMIRVATTLKKLQEGHRRRRPDGYNTEQQLERCAPGPSGCSQSQAAVWEELRRDLAAQRISFLEMDQWTSAIREYLSSYFSREICPVLTPLAFDPGHPFPLISNLSKNFAVVVRHGGRTKFARVKVPDVLPRFVPLPESLLPGGSQAFVFLEDIIRANMQELFPGTQVKSAHLFRVIRDADLEFDQEEADDLLETVDRSLKQLRHGALSLLQVEADMPQRILAILVENFEITDDAVVVRTADRMGFGDWLQLHALHRPELKFAPFTPHTRWRTDADPEEIFDQIRFEDVLVHHPYESFSSVEAFVRAAVRDPHVVAIKMTLYRIGPNSPLIPLLIEAAEAGKQVAVLVELKARFEERNNILWARELESHGIHVVYGFPDLKVHAKLCLVVRQEQGGIQRYVHTGTGNYNPETAKVYTDIGLFTTDPDIVADVVGDLQFPDGLFKPEGLPQPADGAGAAPKPADRADHARGRTRRAPDGRHGMIVKVNAITDDQMIRVLYRASQAGVLDGPARARHLQPAPRHSRHQRPHQGPVDRRPLPRALPHLLVPERRAGRDVHRQRGPDGTEPRPARRNAGACARSGDPRASARRRAGCVSQGHRPGDDASIRRGTTNGCRRNPGRSTRSRRCSSTTRSGGTKGNSKKPPCRRGTCPGDDSSHQRKRDQ